MFGETKPVIRFNGLDKGLVCNKTNAMELASHFGSETNGWINKKIELFPTKVPFQGEMKDAIRVRVPAPPAESVAAPLAQAQPVSAQPTSVPPAGDFNDAIPNWD